MGRFSTDDISATTATGSTASIWVGLTTGAFAMPPPVDNGIGDDDWAELERRHRLLHRSLR
jgi:hypothetical protein